MRSAELRTLAQKHWNAWRHAAVIAELDAKCFDQPWSFERVRKHLTTPMHDGIVLEHVYVMFHLIDGGDRLVIDRLGVDPLRRRRGIGRKLIDAMIAGSEDKTVLAAVDEANLAGQQFMRACGFRCVRIVDGEYIFERRPQGQGYPAFGPVDMEPLFALIS